MSVRLPDYEVTVVGLDGHKLFTGKCYRKPDWKPDGSLTVFPAEGSARLFEFFTVYAHGQWRSVEVKAMTT